MSESLLLRLQPYEHNVGTQEEPVMEVSRIVTGVEVPDKTMLWGPAYNPDLAEEVMPLDWEPDKAERLADYYYKYLMHPDRQDEGWNCHSFVAHVMGWRVFWSEKGYPHHMVHTFRSTNPAKLRDETPYAVIHPAYSGPRHSVMGLPDPTRNLSVWGFRNPLLVTSNEVAAKHYGGLILRHKMPGTMGVLALRASDLGLRDTLPPQLEE